MSKKQNPNVATITAELAKGPKTVQMLKAKTRLSEDQLRRALKAMAVAKVKEGRVTFFRLPNESEVLNKLTRPPELDRLINGPFRKKKNGVKVEKAEKTEARITVSSVARELILAGKTNKEVFQALAEQFDLDDSKKHYPSWYRSQLVRRGEITKSWAVSHARGQS